MLYTNSAACRWWRLQFGIVLCIDLILLWVFGVAAIWRDSIPADEERDVQIVFTVFGCAGIFALVLSLAVYVFQARKSRQYPSL